MSTFTSTQRQTRQKTGLAGFIIVLAAAHSMTTVLPVSAAEKSHATQGTSQHKHGAHDTSAVSPSDDSATLVHGDLTITNGWIRQPVPAAKTGGGYVTIKNNGSENERLIGGSVEFAQELEVHDMKIENDVMIMRELEDGLVIPAGSMVELKPGGLHLMFMGLNDHPEEGDHVDVTLDFEQAGPVTVKVPVGPIGAKAAPGSAAGHDHGNGHDHGKAHSQ